MSQTAGRCRRTSGFSSLDSVVRAALAAAGLILGMLPAHAQDSCRFVQATFADSGDGIAIDAYPAVGGGRLAYVAHAPSVGGTGFGRDLFLFDPATAATVQAFVPPEPGLGPFNISLSDDGRLAVFATRDEVVPGGNADFTSEVFLLDVPTGSFRQLTSSPHFSEEPAISGDGRRVAFSRAVLPPGGGDAVPELTVLDVATGTTSVIAPAFARQLRFDRTGNRLVFRSQDDLIPGSNPTRRGQIFLADLAAGTLVQLTRGEHLFPQEHSIDSAGERVVFHWSEDLVPGQNPDAGDEAYLYEVATGRLSQITPHGGGSPGISGDGTRILLNADDPNGLGEGRGMYLYDVRSGLFSRLSSALAFGVDANHDGTLFALESAGPFSPHPESSSLEVVAAVCDRAVTDVPDLGDAGRLGLALLLAVAGLAALRRLA